MLEQLLDKGFSFQYLMYSAWFRIEAQYKENCHVQSLVHEKHEQNDRKGTEYKRLEWECTRSTENTQLDIFFFLSYNSKN